MEAHADAQLKPGSITVSTPISSMTFTTSNAAFTDPPGLFSASIFRYVVGSRGTFLRIALGCSDKLGIPIVRQIGFNTDFWRSVWKARYCGTINGNGFGSLFRAGARASVVHAAMGVGFSMRSCGWRIRVHAGAICPRTGSAPIRRSSVVTTAGSRWACSTRCSRRWPLTRTWNGFRSMPQ